MKKPVRITIVVLLIVLSAGLLWFCNAMFGNPVSHTLATKSAKAFLSDRFSNTDYQMERITYSFKDGRYHAFITSPTNIDGDFSVCFSMLGEYCYDTYDSVLDGIPRSGWKVSTAN